MNPSSVDALASPTPDDQGVSPAALKALSNAQGRLAAATGRSRETLASEQREIEPATSRLQGIIASPKPAPLQPARQPELPPGLAAPSMAFLTAANLLAGIAGAFSRQHVTSALNAFGGAIQGYSQGRREQAEQKYREWQAASQQAIDAANQQRAEYNRAINDRNLSIEEQLTAIQATALKYKDQNMMDAQDITLAGRLVDMQQQAVNRLVQAKTTIEDKHDATMAEIDKRDKDKASAVNAGLESDKAIRLKVEQYLAGDANAKANIGRGIQGSGNIKKFDEILAQVAAERGLSGEDIAKARAQFIGLTSGERTLGTYGAKLGQASRAVDLFADQALDASKALPRGRFVPANKAIQAFQSGTSDPALYDLGFALFSLTNAYARAINPQGVPRIQDKEHAQQLLNTATSPEALAKVIARIKLETAAEQQATRDEQAQMLNPGAAKPASPAPGGEGWSIKPVEP